MATIRSASSYDSLLKCGMLVGPLYIAVGLAQALTRDGFDFARHPLSVLANGPGGWIQTLNFLVCGAMVVAAGIGIGRALQSRASAWLLSAFGASMMLAAIFRADPMDGFPVGTPLGPPTTMSAFGAAHFAAGAIGFLALAIGCLAVARALSKRGERGMALLSACSGIAVILGFMAPAIVPATGPVAGIWFSVVVGWAWLALTSARLRR